jgi:FHA domain
MPKISCPDCHKITMYENLTDSSVECSYCGMDYDHRSGTEIFTVEEPRRDTNEIVGLTLTYQINHEQIDILAAPKTYLGRESFGANVLSKIYFNGKPVVSRKHCSIEYKDGKFYLQDEGSLNGTFCGENKIDCKLSAHVIEDGGFIFFGEELFHAKIRYKLGDEIANIQIENEVVNSIPTKYRCNDPNCFPAYETENPPKVCPVCGTFDKFIPI